jgi:hypothetical protein
VTKSELVIVFRQKITRTFHSSAMELFCVHQKYRTKNVPISMCRHTFSDHIFSSKLLFLPQKFARTPRMQAGKAVPLQAWTGPEGSWKLRFPDFMRTAQDVNKVVSLTHRPLFPLRKYTWYSFLLEAESTPGP